MFHFIDDEPEEGGVDEEAVEIGTADDAEDTNDTEAPSNGDV